MPHISRYPIDKELREEIFRNLFFSLAGLQNEKDIENLLADLLTPTEKIMISKRLAAAVLLDRGYSYDAIARILKLSPTTVNSVNRELKKSGDGYRLACRLIEKNSRNDSKLDKILRGVDKAISSMSLPIKGSRSSMRRWKRGF